MNKTLLIAVATIAVLLTYGLGIAADTSQERTFTVNSGGTLYIDSDSGSIDIESHDANSVEVEVVKKGVDSDDFKISFEHDNDSVSIKGDNDSSWGFRSLNVKYIVRVPESFNLDLRTGGGSIRVEDLVGNIDARTSGGSIDLGEIAGDIDAKTSGGSIRVEDVAGNINVHTSGGSVKAKLSKQIVGDSKLTTSGGSISVYLLPTMAIDLQASTSGGRVKSDFEVDGVVKKTKIEGTINGGGPTLKLRTSGGSVRVKKL